MELSTSQLCHPLPHPLLVIDDTLLPLVICVTEFDLLFPFLWILPFHEPVPEKAEQAEEQAEQGEGEQQCPRLAMEQFLRCNGGSCP